MPFNCLFLLVQATKFPMLSIQPTAVFVMETGRYNEQLLIEV